jgi:hypothetical protein
MKYGSEGNLITINEQLKNAFNKDKLKIDGQIKKMNYQS